MIRILPHIFRFFLFILLQVFIFNQLELGWGVLPMIYPLMIFLLPVDTELSFALLIAFIMGGLIDLLSNTFGLHTSSLLFFAYARPLILKRFSPREEYEVNTEINLFQMGFSWFATTFGILLLLHHLWFFSFEVADLTEIFYILYKTLVSTVVSFFICIGLQILFIQKPRKK